MEIWQEIVISAFLVVSGVFGLVGSFGLVKLTDPLARLHAPTKATTLGVGGILLASMIHVYATEGKVSFHELLVAIFLFLTAPVTANFIAKMHILHTVKPADLPATGTGTDWATLPLPSGKKAAS
jgi:multicomponent K+:H+ antiporter subunit G